MFILNITNPITLFLTILVVALLIFLGQEIKKSIVVAIPLGVFLAILIMHVVQASFMTTEYAEYTVTLFRCIVIDFLFILVTFFAYLWVDAIEAKANNIKSIDNSLDWFWRDI